MANPIPVASEWEQVWSALERGLRLDTWAQWTALYNTDLQGRVLSYTIQGVAHSESNIAALSTRVKVWGYPFMVERITVSPFGAERNLMRVCIDLAKDREG